MKENIKFFANLYNVNNNYNKIAEEITKSLNLSDKINELSEKLSGGMKRRLNMACSLVHNPDILLLDEPTIELDPFSRLSLWNLIKDINRKGTTVIVSTNSMEEANFVCNKVAFLFGGNLRYIGKPQSVIKLMEDYSWSE